MHLKKQIITKDMIHDWKFWFKLIIGLSIMGLIIGTKISDMVSLMTASKQVEAILASSELKGISIDDIFNKVKEIATLKGFDEARSYMNWISIVPNKIDGDNIGWLSSTSFGDFFINSFTYFTTLSNIAVGIWFLVAALKPQNEGIKGYISLNSTIIVTTYITITLIIYNGILLPTSLMNGDYMSAFNWTTTVLEHMLFPLALILYVALVMKPINTQKAKQYIKKGWVKAIILLLTYGILILIRGEIRYQGNKPVDTQYPYFFLRVHEAKVVGLPGVAWFFIAVIAIAAILIGFSTLYMHILNTRENKIKRVH
ncbi:hypothetical protein ESOMN_v1c03950 [Williamsoniiplasma somnilux]|uniref:Uncharacterized protein n=1 Tax=Williamsoniiplasma somnilux TaxID=215578 RepID=A0A2K8NYB5_9MOLU|nr:Pr6Pr family membrane protein [Williamsoniiplasma somnilux]ATZ18777.1 hypothetical protein ESOMN_v1c03950 [Williamsoniiplasma somnilux]